MGYGRPRRELIDEYVTQQTSPTDAELVARAMQGRLFDTTLTTEETVAVLLRTVRAQHLVDCWLADELDKIEASIAAA